MTSAVADWIARQMGVPITPENEKMFRQMLTEIRELITEEITEVNALCQQAETRATELAIVFTKLVAEKSSTIEKVDEVLGDAVNRGVVQPELLEKINRVKEKFIYEAVASTESAHDFKEGDVVQHFKRELCSEEEKAKNKYLYQILGFVEHTESREPLVLYKALYGEQKLWVRPRFLFYSEVDKSKYPEVKQKYRFEKVGEM